MPFRRRFTAVPAIGLLLLAAACGDDAPQASGAADAYESFFRTLSEGERQTALEDIAPDGALGDTFRGGAYFTYADAIEARLERHGGLDEVVVDGTSDVREGAVRVDGRLRFADGTELERSITFERENDEWVGKL
ncbi:hypothetical protein QWY84_11650 [Aquisalimonas lutea]|uniref:hypothetical protein n=1 Tax=Aquisalimonas lutea TaxID=1327750 RepID=UPI0025B2B5CD|nr:hypothetical protein [Aquisalimonas lutea]MDN3518268.1 hypothetical protein [Aquisalimonas lutea]